MVADLNPTRTFTKREELRRLVHADALILGIRGAARKHGVNEDTACVWAHRYKWQLPDVLKDIRLRLSRGVKSHESTVEAHAHLNRVSEAIDEHGEHSRLYLSASILQASHDLAANAGKVNGERVPYAGLLNASRSGDTVHGWSAARQGPVAQVAVQVNLPTPEQSAERRALDAKLDVLMARLNASAIPNNP